MLTINSKNTYRLELVEKFNNRQDHPVENHVREADAELFNINNKTYLRVGSLGTSSIKSINELEDGVTFMIRTQNSLYKLTDLGVVSSEKN